MNWFDQIEQKRKLIIGGITVICLAMLVVTVRRDNVSYDSFWHLKMGLDWLENDLSLWRDHFSYTFNGREITSPPYMFQILLGSLVTFFGLETGFEAFKLISFISVFSLVALFLHRLHSPAIVVCLVLPLLVALLQLRPVVRPELISYSLSVLAIVLYYKAQNSITPANMIAIAALMLFWSNYHSSVFGYVIFCGLFIELALQQIKQRVPVKIWVKWLLWGLVVVAVGFLNPSLNHPLIATLSFAPEWKTLILEYHSALLYQNVPAIYSIIVIFLITLFMLLRKQQYGLLFVCLVLGFFSIKMSRLVTPSGIILLCIFANVVSEIDVSYRLKRMPLLLARAIGLSVTLIFTVSFASSVHVARLYMKLNRTETLFPEDVVSYMLKNGIQGRIFNEYALGGYLIYRLSPDSQIYIDGRTDILYPLSHFYRYLDARNSADKMRTEIEKYDIKLAVLTNRQPNYSLASDSGLLSLDYVGNRFSLFRKDNPNFPLIGALLANPACWKVGMSAALEAEQTKATQILPKNSFLTPSFINFMVNYGKSADRAAFLDNLQTNRQWPDSKLRFAAYQALSENLDLLAYRLFMEITDAVFSDYLGAALAKARSGEWKTAEQILDSITQRTVSYRPSEIKILHALLVQIGKNIALEYFDDEYIEKIAVKRSLEDETALSKLPEISDFCPGVQLQLAR